MGFALSDKAAKILPSSWPFMRQWYKDFDSAECQDSAAALTYFSLFALVPLMTVCFGIFSLVPSFTDMALKLKHFVFAHFVPQSTAAIQNYLDTFSQQAQQLTVFGILFLSVTAFLMLANIERIFNTIWQVQSSRFGLRKILLYWAILTVGPLLIGGAFAFSTYLLSLEVVHKRYEEYGLEHQLITYLPFLLTFFGLSFLFIAVPNCRVSLRNGFIGGFVTALLVEALKWAFATLVVSSDITFIYGAVAALPLFLLWMNWLWTIILAGVVLVRLLDEKRYRPSHEKLNAMQVALLYLALFAERQRQGLAVYDGDKNTLNLQSLQWHDLREQLLAAAWIVQTQDGGYVLQRDLRQLTLWDLARTIHMNCAELLTPPSPMPLLTDYQEHTESLQKVISEHWDIALADLLKLPSLKTE